MSAFVLVTNTGAPFTGRFDGRNYDFPPGEEVPLTAEAAQHIFGFGLSSKDEVFSRHGWMTKSTEREQAMQRLGQFKFNVGHQQVVADAPQLEIQETETPYMEPGAEVEEEHGTAPVQTGADGGDKGTDGLGQEPPAPTQTKAPQPEAAASVTTEEPGMEDVFH